MKRIFYYTITESEQNKSISDILKEKHFSRAVITHLKRTDHSILLNGIWCHVYDRVKSGDKLEVMLLETEGSPKILPVPLPLDILYEDEDILVVNKAPDTPIHPSLHNYENTLANAVMYYYHQQGMAYTYRCINRLDRDTTGVTLLAKHMLSAGILSANMQKRDFTKKYTAICQGVLPESGTIDAPIARAAESAIERCVDFERGEHAVTHYRCILTDGTHSVAEISLETGRTHQIRVHMQYIGHPLLGDFLYNPDNTEMSRQALHCCSLSFHHPISGEYMTFEAPLPEDMRRKSDEIQIRAFTHCCDKNFL